VAEFPLMRFDDRGERLPFTEQEIDALVPLMTRHYAPRRFALCEVVRDDDGKPFDVAIVAWGIEMGEEVSVVGYPDEHGRRLRGTFSSAESAVGLLSVANDLRLAWADSS
jgi:hypothetical protein